MASTNGDTSGRTNGLVASRLEPSFTVNDLQASIRFYRDGLGFEVTDPYEVEGQLRFVRLAAGTVHLGLGQDDFAKGRDRQKGVGMRIWISTRQDVTALAERAKAAGITLVTEPGPLPWGPLAFSLKDPDGFQITVSEEESAS